MDGRSSAAELIALATAELKVAGGTAVGCFGALLLATVTAATAVTIATAVATGPLALIGAGGGAGTAASGADIPPAMLALYQQAAPTCPGLPWTILAGIGKAESDHGRAHDQVSTAGALGPMQFEATTFAQYDHPTPPGGANPPTPWDPVDAVYAAARLLCANGMTHDPASIDHALHAYNDSDAYEAEVLRYARRYATAYTAAATVPGSGAARALAYARSQIGVPYQWGAEDPGRAFDCSGLAQAAYAAAGIQLPRTAQQQYDHGPQLPAGAALQPGDLVFFGSSPSAIHHVGIAVNATTMIDAPHTGALVRPESIGHPIAATRPG
ncbi:NlpC/P60 family protein [Streptacidiphilus sp. MAP5-3]|uniref:C40 family peptidase n=1 Tax=unclassified Streptacidiphilus TaxID=2643834 RepID=UPI0035173A16